MDALLALKTRRSVRHFQTEPVPEALIRNAVEAAALAPTARNVQPWEFIAVTDRMILAQLGQCTDYGKFIERAPACIAVVCKDTKYYLEDGSAAVTNLLTALHAQGLAACWVAGDKKPYADDILSQLQVPKKGYKLVALVPCGFPTAAVDRPAKRPLDEILHWNRF